MRLNISEKADGLIAYTTSAGVGTSAAALPSGVAQGILFGIALMIGLLRLAYDGIKLYRLWKNKKAM